MQEIDERYRQAVIIHIDINAKMESNNYQQFKYRMKLKNWKIYECESSTWKVVTKKGLIK